MTQATQLGSGSPFANRRDEVGLLTSIIYASVAGEYSLLVMPFVVGAMIDGYGLSAMAAGQIVSLQLLGMALSAVCASVFTRLINPRIAIALCAVTIFGANLACALGGGIPMLLFARFTTGVGEGAAMAVAGALGAGTSRPDRTFSRIGLAVAAAAAFALVLAPWIVHAVGPRGIFWFLSAFALVMLPLSSWIPLERAPKLSAVKLAVRPSSRSQVLRPDALLSLLGLGLFWSGASGLWVFAERIGLKHHFSLQQIGLYLAIGQVAGVPGPMFVEFLSRRMPMRWLFMIAILVNVAAGVMFVFAPAGWAYCLGAALLSFWAMFVTPAFRTLMALLDRQGAVVAASVAFFTIGYGLAPIAVSSFVGPGENYGAVAIICSIFYIASAAAVWVPATRLAKSGLITAGQ